LLRTLSQFKSATTCLDLSKKYHESILNQNDCYKLYWQSLTHFLNHSNKALLRSIYYIHESVDIIKNKACLPLPPIYLLESDDEKTPKVKLETLYEYIGVCYSYLNVNYTPSDDIHLLYKINYNKLLETLIQVVQLTSYIRDNLVTKSLHSNQLSTSQSITSDSDSEFYSNNYLYLTSMVTRCLLLTIGNNLK
jgi:hypothetical protein